MASLEKKLTEFVRKQVVFGSEPATLRVREDVAGSVVKSSPPTYCAFR